MSVRAIAIFLFALRGASSLRYADDSPYGLPRDTEPLAYGLRLAPRYDPAENQYTFGGQVEIWVHVNSITANVTLHARDLEIKSVAIVESKTQTSVAVDGNEMDASAERLVIYAGSSLLPGRVYQVRIVFQGLLRTDMTGFYRSLYTENGERKWMAVTQFKPTYARRAFPCYDEPRFKTPFNISLGRQENQITVSNTALNMTQRLEYYNIWLDHYQPTEPIPTYLVGGLIGQLQKSERINGSEVDVYTYEDYQSQTEYAKKETPALIKTMENYTGIQSIMKKFDYLIVPDFAADGAEGSGLYYYRERYALIDDESKTKFREQSTMVIQQQLSHQWFGTLVTCSRWDFMWLNEGFARYFQYFATKTEKSKWRLEELFVVEQHQTALEFDQTPRHPLTVSAKTPDDILNIIDRITYNKASAFLRMLKYIVTDDNFHQPLILFLQTFRNSSVNPSDLWAVFENFYFDHGFKLQENVQFTDFVLSWTDQSGYPVVTVIRNNSTYEITQQRFSIWPVNDTNTQWYIGLSYTDGFAKNFEDLTPVRWLKPGSTVTIRNVNLSTWSIFNLQSTGFYRVNYDEENWNQLVRQLNGSHRAIHVLNRAQLIDDSFNLARAGMLNYSIALDLSTYLNNEEDYMPWYSAIDCLSYVVERMRRSAEGYNYIKSYVRNLADLINSKTESLVLEFGSKDHTTITSWNKFSVWACYLEGENCMKNALGNFRKWTMEEKISPEIKDAVFCAGVKVYNDTETWRGMFKVYTTTKSASEKNSAQYALTCIQDITLLYKYLDFLFDSDKYGPVRLQDFKDICNSMSLTPQGIEALTNFLMNNMEKILKTVLAGEDIVTHIYRVLASKVALDNEIIKLYNLKNAPGLPSRIKSSFDESYMQVEQNLHWYKNYHIDINQWTGAPMDPPTEPSATSELTTQLSTSSSTTTSPATTSPATTSPATTSPATTSPATTSPETTSPATTSPTETSRNSTSPITNPPPSSPSYTTFDFEETTRGSISRCPEKSGAPSRPIPAFVVFVMIIITLVIGH